MTGNIAKDPMINNKTMLSMHVIKDQTKSEIMENIGKLVEYYVKINPKYCVDMVKQSEIILHLTNRLWKIKSGVIYYSNIINTRTYKMHFLEVELPFFEVYRPIPSDMDPMVDDVSMYHIDNDGINRWDALRIYI